jgi:predicted TIM-barrel fold metal-dependent hydrolase
MTRRELLQSAPAAVAAGSASAQNTPPGERIIDIHQHTNYSGRSNDDLVAHQRKLGVTTTVLLPAGSKYGLAAQAGGNETVVALARQYPKEYVYFANELPDIPEAAEVIRKFLKLGAIGIGEQKFKVDADSAHVEKIADLAKEFRVPVLLHFQHGEYNLGIERFHRILEKYPTVNFIGHAQTWWGNIDQKHDQTVMYPKTRVTPGGLTDRYLASYPNMFGDLSAGSGLNALLRDEEHARAFIERHQNKLLFGSDCNDSVGEGPKCSGSQCIAAIRRLSPNAAVARKLLHDNAVRVLKIRA